MYGMPLTDDGLNMPEGRTNSCPWSFVRPLAIFFRQIFFKIMFIYHFAFTEHIEARTIN